MGTSARRLTFLEKWPLDRVQIDSQRSRSQATASKSGATSGHISARLRQILEKTLCAPELTLSSEITHCPSSGAKQKPGYFCEQGWNLLMHALAIWILLVLYTPKEYGMLALTVIESPLFTKLWPDYWTEEERGEFAAYVANSPETGEVIPGSGGCRKIRWSRSGVGKRSGVRVIYTVRLVSGSLVLLVIYAKNARENIPARVLKKIAEEMGYGTK